MCMEWIYLPAKSTKDIEQNIAILIFVKISTEHSKFFPSLLTIAINRIRMNYKSGKSLRQVRVFPKIWQLIPAN